jgi:hypothetical protein
MELESAVLKLTVINRNPQNKITRIAIERGTRFDAGKHSDFMMLKRSNPYTDCLRSRVRYALSPGSLVVW